MADTKVMSPSEVAEEHQQEAHAPYLWVWLWLLILTVVEYFYAAGLKDFFAILLLGLLVLAGIKAGLVGWYFMHLKFEGKWVYLLIVPAIILATIFVLALIPDQAMKPVDEDAEETVRMLPMEGAPGLCPRIVDCLSIRQSERTNCVTARCIANLSSPLGLGDRAPSTGGIL